MTGLPQGWAVAKVEQLFELVRGVTYDKTEVVAHAQPGFVGVLRATNIQNGEADRSDLVYAPAHCVSEKQMLQELDLLIATSSGSRSVVGKLAEIGKGFEGHSFGAFCSVARPLIPEFSKWVSYFSKSRAYRDYVEAVALGTNINNFRSRDIDRLEIPLPPLPEQRRIVRRLETLSARSTTARTHVTAIEKLVERMRGAVLSQALNGRLVASQLDCGEPTELGQFITGIEQGWSPKCDNEPELDPTKWAVLTTTAIQAITFDSTENKRLPENLSPRPHLEVEAGDVLMTRAGPRVRCAVCCYVAETAPRRIFSDKIYRIRLDKSVEPEFFAMMMNAPEMVRALDAIKSGGSESGLNLTQDRLKSLAINIWDRPTQVEVVADIKRQFAKIDRLAAEAAKALKLLGHLDQRILAKAFAGDLVPQDSNDEPAETLLARIREARAAAPKSRRGRK